MNATKAESSSEKVPDGGSGVVEELAGDALVSISNEFARVVVRKVYTRNGERLEITAPFFHAIVRLDPLQLETLARQDHALFERLSADLSKPE
jgi:hypothetical protein